MSQKLIITPNLQVHLVEVDFDPKSNFEVVANQPKHVLRKCQQIACFRPRAMSYKMHEEISHHPKQFTRCLENILKTGSAKLTGKFANIYFTSETAINFFGEFEFRVKFELRGK